MQSTHASARSAELAAKLERKVMSFMVITILYNVITYINIFPHDASIIYRNANDYFTNPYLIKNGLVFLDTIHWRIKKYDFIPCKNLQAGLPHTVHRDVR